MRLRLLPILLLLISLPAAAQYPGAAPPPARWKTGFDSIRQETARKHLGMLAGPDFRGRSPFSEDFMAATGYVRYQMENMGLTPGGADGSYEQPIMVYSSRIEPLACSIETTDGSVQLQFGRDFNFNSRRFFSGQFKLAFLRAPKGADLSKIDFSKLAGRLLINAEANSSNSDLVPKLADPSVSGKVLTAITDTFGGAGAPRQPLPSVWVRNTEDTTVIPVGALRIKRPAVMKLAEKAGAKQFIAGAGDVATLELSDVDVTVRAGVSKTSIEATNLIGVIEGSDPELKDEVVVIGAHLDHLGTRTPGSIYWGADDNGSGSTGLLVMAEAILKNPVRPKRTIVFCWWACEEDGVLGSLYYSIYPRFPLEKTVAYFNTDMLGRNEEFGKEKAADNQTSIYKAGSRFNSPDLDALVVRTNRYVGLRLKEEMIETINNSDTRNFVLKGIPTLKAFTGKHPDYHKPTDTIEKINFEKMNQILKWLYLSLCEIADAPQRPRFVKTPFVAADKLGASGK